MEVFRSKDNTVSKYIHSDGSETAIKLIPKEKFGGEYGKVTNKFNVFISSDVGCVVDCKFCYLHTKKCPIYALTAEQITDNIVKAVKAEIKHNPSLSKLYCKLSWMGMSDPLINMQRTFDASIAISDKLIGDGIIIGLDSLDISSTVPNISNNTSFLLEALNSNIGPLCNNPLRKGNGRSNLRFFYSLHSSVQKTRDSLIPHSRPIKESLDLINNLKNKDITCIIHQMFFNDVNDAEYDINGVSEIVESLDVELRILRFNKCPGSKFNESSKFNYIVADLLERHNNIKVQSSPGSEVSAACGQFLLSKIKKY